MKEDRYICNQCEKEIFNMLKRITVSNVANSDIHFCSITCAAYYFTNLNEIKK